MAFVAVLSHFWVEQGLSVAELCALMSNEIVPQPTKTGQSLVPAIPILTCQNGAKPKLHLSKPTLPHPPHPSVKLLFKEDLFQQLSGVNGTQTSSLIYGRILKIKLKYLFAGALGSFN